MAETDDAPAGRMNAAEDDEPVEGSWDEFCDEWWQSLGPRREAALRAHRPADCLAVSPDGTTQFVIVPGAEPPGVVVVGPEEGDEAGYPDLCAALSEDFRLLLTPEASIDLFDEDQEGWSFVEDHQGCLRYKAAAWVDLKQDLFFSQWNQWVIRVNDDQVPVDLADRMVGDGPADYGPGEILMFVWDAGFMGVWADAQGLVWFELGPDGLDKQLLGAADGSPMDYVGSAASGDGAWLEAPSDGMEVRSDLLDRAEAARALAQLVRSGDIDLRYWLGAGVEVRLADEVALFDDLIAEAGEGPVGT